MVQIGFDTIGILNIKRDRSVIEISKGSSLEIFGKVTFGAGCNISIGSNSKITLKGNNIFNGNTTLISHRGIYFGKNTLCSWDCIFLDTDFHRIIQDGIILNPAKEIVIKNDVWIGCRVSILKGSLIERSNVIGACSVVSGLLRKQNCIYARNLAKPIKENIMWEI